MRFIFIFIALWAFGISVFAQNHIPTFVYHRVGDARYPSTNISTAVFEEQLNYLKTNGYRTARLSELPTLVNQTPAKWVALTIDDAYTSFYEYGFPLLKKYGFTASLFVNTENVGGKGYMSWTQIKEMADYGIEIGNHTHSHAYFLSMADAEKASAFEKEVRLCQQLLKENLDIEAKSFAYPFGEWDDALYQVIKKFGFTAVAAQNSGVFYSGSDPLLIPRFPMGGPFATYKGFVDKVKMKALPLKVDSTFVRGSQQVWHLQLEDAASFGAVNVFKSGSAYEYKKLGEGKMEISLPLRPSIRRTLLTFTAPQNGVWHWWSFVHVNPAIAE
ncbi:polysaccharide deacetylase family protein [Cytophagales bacterium LB-30]|uniref:Polysaccharide deacetylase family protein n=1 Tax=Shiella aurantiaca TaxID=3058365 RepID=A0ABT8F121_9BACT|nr:polysaccharide deacetylase family protein [Shiella aurantiaca]MDN4163983.1 polysaccharide deacetylase family protein [Shiella aurantiaca]